MPITPTPKAVNPALEKERLIAFYKANSAEDKLGDVDATITRYCADGPEGVEKMWRLLAKKYNTTAPPYAKPEEAAKSEGAAVQATSNQTKASGAVDASLEKERLIAFYKSNNAEDKLSDVDATIARYCADGPEGVEKMWRLLAKKYNTTAPPYNNVVADSSTAPVAQASSVADPALEKERLIAFYKANNAEDKLGDVDATIARYCEDGPEGVEKMWRLLAKKYNTTAPPYTSSSPAAAVPAVFSPAVDIPLEIARLTSFYEANNAADKLGDVHTTVNRYAADGPEGIEKMWRLLAKKYNTTVPPYMPTAGPPSEFPPAEEWTTAPPDEVDGALETQRLTDFYVSVGAQDKLSDVPLNIQRYSTDGPAGIAKMWRLLSEKYKVDIPPYERRLKNHSGNNSANKRGMHMQEGGLSTFSAPSEVETANRRLDIPAEVRALEEYFFAQPQTHPSNPHGRAANAAAMVKEAALFGIEGLDAMWFALAKEYKTEVPPQQVRNRVLLPEISDVMALSASSHRDAVDNTGHKSSSSLHDEYRRKLEMFFSYYDPRKLDQIDSMMLMGETDPDANHSAKSTNASTRGGGGNNNNKSPKLSSKDKSSKSNKSFSNASEVVLDPESLGSRKLAYERDWYEGIIKRLEERYGPMPTQGQYYTMSVFPEFRTVPEEPPILSVVPRGVPETLDIAVSQEGEAESQVPLGGTKGYTTGFAKKMFGRGVNESNSARERSPYMDEANKARAAALELYHRESLQFRAPPYSSVLGYKGDDGGIKPVPSDWWNIAKSGANHQNPHHNVSTSANLDSSTIPASSNSPSRSIVQLMIDAQLAGEGYSFPSNTLNSSSPSGRVDRATSVIDFHSSSEKPSYINVNDVSTGMSPSPSTLRTTSQSTRPTGGLRHVPSTSVPRQGSVSQPIAHQKFTPPSSTQQGKQSTESAKLAVNSPFGLLNTSTAQSTRNEDLGKSYNIGEGGTPFRGLRGEAASGSTWTVGADGSISDAGSPLRDARSSVTRASSVVTVPPPASYRAPAISATEEVLNRANPPPAGLVGISGRDPTTYLRSTSQAPLVPLTPIPYPQKSQNDEGSASSSAKRFPIIVPVIVKLASAPPQEYLASQVQEADRLQYLEKLTTDFAAATLLDPLQIQIMDVCPGDLYSIKFLLSEEQARRNVLEGFVQKALSGIVPLRHASAFSRGHLANVGRGQEREGDDNRTRIPDITIATAACFGEFKLLKPLADQQPDDVMPDAETMQLFSVDPSATRRAARLVRRTNSGGVSQEGLAPEAGLLVSELSSNRFIEHNGGRNNMQGRHGRPPQTSAAGATDMSSHPSQNERTNFIIPEQPAPHHPENVGRQPSVLSPTSTSQLPSSGQHYAASRTASTIQPNIAQRTDSVKQPITNQQVDVPLVSAAASRTQSSRITTTNTMNNNLRHTSESPPPLLPETTQPAYQYQPIASTLRAENEEEDSYISESHINKELPTQGPYTGITGEAYSAAPSYGQFGELHQTNSSSHNNNIALTIAAQRKISTPVQRTLSSSMQQHQLHFQHPPITPAPSYSAFNSSPSGNRESNASGNRYVHSTGSTQSNSQIQSEANTALQPPAAADFHFPAGGGGAFSLAPENYVQGVRRGRPEPVHSSLSWGRVMEGRDRRLEPIGDRTTPDQLENLFQLGVQQQHQNLPPSQNTLYQQNATTPSPNMKFSSPYQRQDHGLSPERGGGTFTIPYRDPSQQQMGAANRGGLPKSREDTLFSQEALSQMDSRELVNRLGEYQQIDRRRAQQLQAEQAAIREASLDALRAHSEGLEKQFLGGSKEMADRHHAEAAALNSRQQQQQQLASGYDRVQSVPPFDYEPSLATRGNLQVTSHPQFRPPQQQQSASPRYIQPSQRAMLWQPHQPQQETIC